MGYVITILVCLLVFINGIPAMIRLRGVPWSPLWVVDNAPWATLAVFAVVATLGWLAVKYKG